METSVSSSPPSLAAASSGVAATAAAATGAGGAGVAGGAGGVSASVKADLPRSQPISVAKKDKCGDVDDVDDDDDDLNSRLGHINSLSPPSVIYISSNSI